MKRGFGSPKYNKERARQVQRAGNAALRASGRQHRFQAGTEAQAACAKSRASRMSRIRETPCAESEHNGAAKC